jgi:alpha-ribazole phosphatase
MKLILVRHGETDWNTERRYQGQLDVPLNGRGEWQAQLAGRALAGEAIERIVSSDLRRAFQTARAIAAACSLPVTADARLREISFGSWEGLNYDQILEQDGDAYRRWKENPVENAPTGGETLAVTEQRVLSLWQEIKEIDLETVALVSHGGTLRILLSYLLKLPPESFWETKLGNASITTLRVNHSAVTVDVLNDMRHWQAHAESG